MRIGEILKKKRKVSQFGYNTVLTCQDQDLNIENADLPDFLEVAFRITSEDLLRSLLPQVTDNFLTCLDRYSNIENNDLPDFQTLHFG